jgi:hypothetical protein
MIKKVSKAPVKKTSISKKTAVKTVERKIVTKKTVKTGKKTSPATPANPPFKPNSQKPVLHRRPLLVYTK